MTGLARTVAGVIFIVELLSAEDLFRRIGRGAPLLTTTLRDIKRGPLRGTDAEFSNPQSSHQAGFVLFYEGV